MLFAVTCDLGYAHRLVIVEATDELNASHEAANHIRHKLGGPVVKILEAKKILGEVTNIHNRSAIIVDTEMKMKGFDPSGCVPILVMLGYKQISRKFRTIARLPENYTSAKEALYEASMKEHARVLLRPDGKPKNKQYGEAYENWKGQTRKWVEAMGEQSCLGYYLRCHSPDRLELDKETFEDFKKAGGRAA